MLNFTVYYLQLKILNWLRLQLNFERKILAEPKIGKGLTHFVQLQIHSWFGNWGKYVSIKRGICSLKVGCQS